MVRKPATYKQVYALLQKHRNPFSFRAKLWWRKTHFASKVTTRLQPPLPELPRRGDARRPGRVLRGQGRAERHAVAGGQVAAGRGERGAAPGPHWRRRWGAAPRRPPHTKCGRAGGGVGVGSAMQSCGRWWGRLAARGASRHLRAAAGGQRRWGGGEAARCIEQLLPRHDDFAQRHIGPREREKREMLRAVGVQVGDRAMPRRAERRG